MVTDDYRPRLDDCRNRDWLLSPFDVYYVRFLIFDFGLGDDLDIERPLSKPSFAAACQVSRTERRRAFVCVTRSVKS